MRGRFHIGMLAAVLVVWCQQAVASKEPSKELGYPFIRNYPPNEYDEAGQVFAVVQDHRGVMYFGADYNVLEFVLVSIYKCRQEEMKPLEHMQGLI